MNGDEHQQISQNARFLWLASQPSVVKRAAKIAMIVGVVLAAINHGDKIVTGSIDLADTAKILLTFLVPYSVSTYSSVLAIREKSQLVQPRP